MKPRAETTPKNLASFLLGTLLAACFAGCSSQEPPPSEPAADQAEAQEPSWVRIEGLRAQVYKGKALESSVMAETASLALEGAVAVLDGVNAVLYEGEERTGLLTSKQGQLFLKNRPGARASENDLILSGGVEIAARNLFFLSPRIRYFSKQALIVSSGGPFEQRIGTGEKGLVMTGGWFVATRNLRKFEYYENLHLTGALADLRREGAQP